jgi:hypothetical protein
LALLLLAGVILAYHQLLFVYHVLLERTPDDLRGAFLQAEEFAHIPSKPQLPKVAEA